MAKRKLTDDPIDEPDLPPDPQPEPDPVPVKDADPISLRSESKDGKQIVDNTYMAPSQRNYEKYVSEGNPRGVH